LTNRDLTDSQRFQRYFELRPHTYRKTLHGREFHFDYPVFTTDLLGSMKDTGLFISIRDGSELDAYVFIDEGTLKIMMDEEPKTLARIPAEKIIDFATRNKSMMTKLVIDLNITGHTRDEFVTEMESVEVTISTGRTVRIYGFSSRMVEISSVLTLNVHRI
jgi:hypothetical protein